MLELVRSLSNTDENLEQALLSSKGASLHSVPFPPPPTVCMQRTVSNIPRTDCTWLSASKPVWGIAGSTILLFLITWSCSVKQELREGLLCLS